MFKSHQTVSFGLALSVLLGGLAIASPVLAQQAQDTDTPYPPQSSPLAETPAPGQSTSGMHKSMHHHGNMKGEEKFASVEDRIKTLHEKLQITASQENEFKTMADTMRDNEKAMHALIKERHETGENMTAIDDLQSYQKIAEEHAEGLGKLISAFTPLYNDMSDAQKKNADMVFGTYAGHRDEAGGKHMKHMKKSTSSGNTNE